MLVGIAFFSLASVAYLFVPPLHCREGRGLRHSHRTLRGGDPNGTREELEFRLTMCFRKIDGRWRVLHEHHSLPAD
jgi:hypothetical protein